MVPVDLIAVIRHKVHAEIPIPEIAGELGLSRNTIRRYACVKRVSIDRSSLPTRSPPGPRTHLPPDRRASERERVAQVDFFEVWVELADRGMQS
jgi:hypothetical protein